MKALLYDKPKSFRIADIPIPKIADDEVLVKGMCGTDAHIHDGEFISTFPLVPGHEVVGEIAQVGKDVNALSETKFQVGDRVVADNSDSCNACFYCRRGRDLLCENFASKGCTMNGGFAEYVNFRACKVYKLQNLPALSATLIEPAACAVHGLDTLRRALTSASNSAPLGSSSALPCSGLEILLLGAGPTGILLAQLLKRNGALRVVVAAHKGVKMDIAKKLGSRSGFSTNSAGLGVADEYVEIERDGERAKSQWEKLRRENPYGFDVVIEATGIEKLANESINYVRRGGILMMYGVYSNEALVHWSPAKIFGDEITVIGSFAQTYCFPRAVAYLDSGKIDVKGMVTDVFALEDFKQALDKMHSRTALKIAIRP